MKISFIIPVYNSKEYIAQCIESVVSANEEDIEIILIDDASQDGSTDICQEYSQKYKEVHLIVHKTNQGVSFSRNEGLSVAKGEYLYFLDSDDYIETSQIKKIIGLLDQYPVDMLLVEYQQVLLNENLKVKYAHEMPKEGLQSLEELFSHKHWLTVLPGPMWRCLIKSDLVKNNKIFYPNLDYGEDGIFMMNVLQYVKDIYYTSDIFYNYRIEIDNSLTTHALNDKWKMNRYFEKRFLALARFEKLEKYKDCIFLQKWFQVWIQQCIRGFLFEEDWKLMIKKIGQACDKLPNVYIKRIMKEKSVFEYFEKYRNDLFKRLSDSKKIYILPVCKDNAELAGKWKKNGIEIYAFLDNNTREDNHNLRYAIDMGYRVKNLKKVLENGDFEQDIFVICHWQKNINSIHKQLQEYNVLEDNIIEIPW